MTVFLTILHILICLALIGIVLLQAGKGAEVGAAFGAGASQTMFGSRGATTVFHKVTAGVAVAFMVTSLCLAYYSRKGGAESVVDQGAIDQGAVEEPAPAAVPPVEPAAPAEAPQLPGAPAETGDAATPETP